MVFRFSFIIILCIVGISFGQEPHKALPQKPTIFFNLTTNIYQKPKITRDFGEGDYLKGVNGVGIGGGLSLVNSFRWTKNWFYEINLEGKLINIGYKTPLFPTFSPSTPVIRTDSREYIGEFIADFNFFVKKYKPLSINKLWSYAFGIGISSASEVFYRGFVLGYNNTSLNIEGSIYPHIGLVWLSPNLKIKTGIHGKTKYKNLWGVELQASFIPIYFFEGSYFYSNTPQDCQGRIMGRASNIGLIGHFSFW